MSVHQISIHAVYSQHIFNEEDGLVQIKERRGEVYSGQFVICDPERDYSESLLKYLSEKEKEDYQFQLFHDVESLEVFCRDNFVDVLLIAEEYEAEKKPDIRAKRKFILTEEVRQEKDGEKRSICRYQPVGNMIKILFEEPEDSHVLRPQRVWKEKVQSLEKQTARKGLIGVYSPVHRIGKTKFAIQLGKKTAQCLPTLYLNMEEYPASSLYFPEQKEKNLGDLLYYAGQNKENLGLRISTMAGRMEDLDYIMPIPVMQDLRAVKEEEWLNLFDQILKKCIYETVILDLGDSIDGLYSILKNCSAVYTHYADEPAAAEKIRQYEANIKRMGMEEILEHTIRKKVTRRNKSISTEKRRQEE